MLKYLLILADESKFDEYMKSKFNQSMAKAAANNRPQFGPQSKKKRRFHRKKLH